MEHGNDDTVGLYKTLHNSSINSVPILLKIISTL